MGQVLPHIDFNEYNWPCFTGTDWMSPRGPLDTRPFQRLRKEASKQAADCVGGRGGGSAVGGCGEGRDCPKVVLGEVIAVLMAL